MPPSPLACPLVPTDALGRERAQFKLLCEQNLAAVWRKRAYRNLLEGWESLLPEKENRSLFAAAATAAAAVVGGGRTSNSDGDALVERLKTSIVVFREGVDFTVENSVPEVFDYVQKLTQRVADTHELCEGDEERMAVSHIMKLVVEADFGADPRKAAAAAAAKLGGGGGLGAGGGGSSRPRARAIFAYEPLHAGDLRLEEVTGFDGTCWLVMGLAPPVASADRP